MVSTVTLKKCKMYGVKHDMMHLIAGYCFQLQ